MQYVHLHANASVRFNVWRQVLDFVPCSVAVFVESFVCRYFLLFIWDTLLISPSTKYFVTRLTDLTVRLCSENNLRELVK